MTDTNRVALRYGVETSFGVLPGSPTFKELRYTKEGIKPQTASTKSMEIRSDRNIADIIRTGVSSGGPIDFELSYGAFDDFFAYTLGNTTFPAIHTISALTTIAAVSGSNSFTDSANSFTVANGYAPGAWIKVSGFTGGAATNNRFWRIKTHTSDGALVVEGGAVVTQTAGTAITIVRGASVKNSNSAQPTVTLEKSFTDASGSAAFESTPGTGIDKLSINIPAEGIITGSFNAVGKNSASGSATLSTGGTPTTAPTNPVLNGIDHVQLIVENLGSTDTTIVSTGISFDISGNIRARHQIGTLGTASIGNGSFDISGKISFYYSSSTLIDKHLNWTSTNFAVAVAESASSANAYIFDFPRVRITDSNRNATGLNADVMVDASFSSYMDPTLGYMFQIVKFT